MRCAEYRHPGKVVADEQGLKIVNKTRRPSQVNETAFRFDIAILNSYLINIPRVLDHQWIGQHFCLRDRQYETEIAGR